MTWNISRWEKLSLEKSSKSLERPHCCSTCKKFLRWASAQWASIQSGKKLSLRCVVSLLWYYEWRHVSIYVFVLLFNINFQLLNVFFWQCCSPLVLKGWFQNPPLKLLPTFSRTYLTLQVITQPWTLLTTNYVAERFPEFLALVFEPEFMNSAGKEVLMDMAEQRHLLPVYRSDKL